MKWINSSNAFLVISDYKKTNIVFVHLRRIKIDKKCVGIAEDFEGYRFPEAVEGKAISNNPIKDGFYEHGCDAFRYFILNRFPIRSNFVGRIPR